ncbi:BadF/BadG/BcrA/BcrD ATPase family protein [Candidatus Desulfosporosinus infrequens]|uniref:BadF/BadG/BcrA/BcrD ATPase family protein n=1 Tax=Candidatus Desulfosporosinus infrequens TaxID=2043169 RepID=A0A2U3KCA4_9FIRM|nr:BadF/BadG/BcrA/BcrD ATPase family protein [Candidatus Desulfosporosinus infrequens]
MRVKVGVDGGGSKTEIVALDRTGQVLRCLRKPASNYHVVGMENAVQNIIEGIRDSIQEDTLEGIGISLAGIDTLEDWQIMADGLKQRLMVLAQEAMISYREVPVVLENDAFGALMSVRGRFFGNVLSVGTGVVALGVNPEGEVFRVGGWGHLIGDQGGGYDIGRKALAATAASFDGYGPKSLLETKITKHLGLTQVRDISDWIYRSQRSNKEVAALVPVVVEAAREGDNISKLILDESGRALGVLTKALLRKTNGTEIGLVGGIGSIWEFMKPSFFATVQEEFPTLQILKPNYPPSVGAALLSMISQVRHIIF